MDTERLTYTSADGTELCALAHEAASGTRVASVVLAHGLNVDKNEDNDSQAGIPPYVELAAALTDAQFNVLRFDFRGHGESGGEPESMTVRGELADLTASLDIAR